MPEQITAIVTGHSRGLGAAIAAELLGRGARVLGLARQGNPALAAAYPEALTEVALDLADPAALAEWLPGLRAHLQGQAPCCWSTTPARWSRSARPARWTLPPSPARRR
ncbi:SDR family NAD(P)-dependent oxidoreductase [Frigidibacter mobilis]|uniref:SDR family NAD(P)-dependent oxidoreductase n=1 Tax=Frigidibacter mobilis TaxID=1335048 RepID=UPI000A67C416|nr:SDR family NAD(P)-dependent oxidoreductase [Frigidibacter mobilis]